MKKTLFFMIILAIFATGCKKEKSKSLNYDGPSTVTIALRDYYKLPVSSEYDVTYSTSDDMHVTVSADGTIYGKNVGNANITISNGYETTNVPVNVELFIQPTFEFGCSPNLIRDLYGSPYQAGYNGDGVLVYRYTSYSGYSYACGEMDFFFDDARYIESDVYIRPSVEFLLDSYLNENFDYAYEFNDTISQDTIVTVSIYKYKLDEEIYCGKRLAMNEWNEILLFYLKVEDDNLAKSLYIRPRSSKLRY